MDDFIVEEKELCTEEEWTSFFASRCWAEFLDTVKLRLSDTRTRLEDCDKDMFQRLQGMAQEDRIIIEMPKLILGEFKSKAKENEDA